MATITDKLNQLESDREDLVDNLTTKGISGLTGDETFTELVPEVLNIPSGGDLSNYWASPLQGGGSSRNYSYESMKKFPSGCVGGENMSRFFNGCINLEEIGIIDTSNTTTMVGIFRNCKKLKTAPLFDMSNVTSANNMFEMSDLIENIPAYNTVKVTTLANMFGYIYPKNLTDDSLNNILGMCIKANSTYTSTKTLASVMFGTAPGDVTTYYPVSRIEGLSNYQDFIDAGWTIGWS